jgi:predicted metalloendopeptidase
MLRLALALACSLTIAAGCAAPVGAPLRSGIDLVGGDPLVRPQDDLYRRVNGRWVATTEIPADRAYIGTWEEVQDRAQAELRGLIDAAGSRRDDADARRIAALYASFMDEATVEAKGLAPLAEALAMVDAIASTADLARAFGRLARLGVDTPLHVFVDQDPRDATRYVPLVSQGGLGVPDRDYYLVADDPKFAAARASYAAYIARLLELSKSDASAGSAEAVMALERALARGQWSRVENRDPVKTYHKVAIDALAPLAPAFDWPAWLAASGLAGRSADVIVYQPSYLGALSAEIAATPLAVWKTYLRVHLLHAYAPYLGKAFVDARFAYTGTALAGAAELLPRWRRGVALVDASLGEALGKLYVEATFPPAAKARAERLVANLLATYRDSIESLDWMGPATKREAQAKLATFAPKIGYPKRWIDYSPVVIRADDLVGNVERAREFAWARDLAKLGKPVDRDEWFMTPQTVNAYYNASMNEIVFPASVLQPPLFDAAADDAVNYGAIGAVIGHEISHGFDDEGSQYDGSGNLRVWWTDADRKRFEEKTKRLVAQYSAFSPLPGYTVNGELTLGENIADNAGLEMAYKAYHRSLAGKPAPVIDGMSGDERFFYGYAQAYRSKTREALLLTWIKSDPHTPDEFRVKGAVRNHPAFYSTFGVQPGDGMYLPPEERVTIW